MKCEHAAREVPNSRRPSERGAGWTRYLERCASCGAVRYVHAPDGARAILDRDPGPWLGAPR